MKKSLNEFIEETKGTQVDVPWKSKNNLKGECVSLIQQYISQCLDQPAKARGHAIDWIQSYVNEGLGHTVSDQRTGDIIVFPKESEGKGHIAIYVDGKLYDQNNLRHDNGLAGFGEIFSWDFVTLRPNISTQNIQYLNLHHSIDSWRIYPLNVTPIIGNECAKLNPKKYNGLSYSIKKILSENVVVISTKFFGDVQIYINSKYATITNEPYYNLVN